MKLENVEDIFPLSPMQAGMLFHAIEAVEQGVYVLQIRVALQGDPCRETLAAAWDEVVQRHDALRAAFVWEGLEEPLQVIHERLRTPWHYLDAVALEAESGADALDDWLAADRHRGFDLTQAPLMRMALIDLGGGAHRLVWTLHHVLADAWSVAIALQELQDGYQARVSGGTTAFPEPARYRDFIAWLRGRDLEAARPVWQRYLAGFTTPIEVSLAPPADAVPGGNRVVHERIVPETVTAALTDVARQRRITVTSIYHVAWALVLSRHAGSRDIVFGSVVSGRGHGLPGAERSVGLYMNTIPVRVDLDAAPTLGALISQVHETGLTLRPYENTSLGRISEWSDVKGGTPLFDSLFIVENHPPARHQAGDLVFGDVDPLDQSNYPLAAFVMPGDPLRLLVLVDPAEVSQAAADRLLAQFAEALARLPDHLEEAPLALPVLPAQEREQLDRLAKGPALPAPPGRSILERIDAHLQADPGAPALVFGSSVMSYDALGARAAAVAQRLEARGVGRGDRVAILLERGPEVVVAMLGVLEAGAAYLPLDPTYPPARAAQVLDNAAPALVLTTDALAEAFAIDPSLVAPMAPDVESPERERLAGPRSGAGVTLGAGTVPEPHDPAYVIYTSGSTGEPKGVVVTHGNLLASTAARFEAYETPPGVFLLLSSFAFDSSVAGIYWTLAAGGTLVIGEPALEQDMGRLADCIGKNAVTHTLCLPTLYEVVLEFAPPARLATLNTVIVAGEAAGDGLLARHRACVPSARLYNEYGPTEATVWCTVCELTALDHDGAAPIGRPVPGAEVRILTDSGRLAPLGAAGELWVGGPGVAEGYFSRPGATDEVFTTPPALEGRWYRTGDLGRYDARGLIEFLGRRDRQVKIRGHRIETSEIEAVLRQHPAVTDAWVAALGDADTGERLSLAAAVVLAPDVGVTPTELQDHVRSRLPGYMTPAKLAVVGAFPRLPNGKVDASRLESLLLVPAAAEARDEAPIGDFEEALAALWSEVLGVEHVSRHDDFFELGGDSIASIRIVALAQARGYPIAPSEIFEYPTLAELSGLRRGSAADAADAATATGESAPAARPGASAPEATEVRPASPALFMVHGGRRIEAQLAEQFGASRRLHSLSDRRDSGAIAPFASVESLAAEYLASIDDGGEVPRLLGGYSVGAPIALAMARQIRADGGTPPLVFLLDPPDDPERFAATVPFEPLAASAQRTAADPRLSKAAQQRDRGLGGSLSRWWHIFLGSVCRTFGWTVPLAARRHYVAWVYDRALRGHALEAWDGPMLIFHSADAMRDAEGKTLWAYTAVGDAETVNFDARHTEFVRNPDVVREWTADLVRRLELRERAAAGHVDDPQRGPGNQDLPHD